MQERLPQIPLSLGFIPKFYHLEYETQVGTLPFCWLTMIWCMLTVFIQKLSFSSFSPEPWPTCGLVLFSSCLPTARKTSPLQVLNSKPQHRLQIKMETAVLTFFFGALPVSVLHQHFMVQHFPHHFFFPCV